MRSFYASFRSQHNDVEHNDITALLEDDKDAKDDEMSI